MVRNLLRYIGLMQTERDNSFKIGAKILAVAVFDTNSVIRAAKQLIPKFIQTWGQDLSPVILVAIHL